MTAQELAAMLRIGCKLEKSDLANAAAMIRQQAEQIDALKAALNDAATSRQETKIKALVDALELVSPAEKSALDRAYVNGNATAALTNYAATKETP